MLGSCFSSHLPLPSVTFRRDCTCGRAAVIVLSTTSYIHRVVFSPTPSSENRMDGLSFTSNVHSRESIANDAWILDTMAADAAVPDSPWLATTHNASMVQETKLRKACRIVS